MQPHESDIPTSRHRRITNLDFLQILFTFGPRDSASELRNQLQCRRCHVGTPRPVHLVTEYRGPKTSGGESPDRQPHPAWLSCPRDRSRQLRVELQLDRACHIGYIDIGNSGSAFLQIDVGRSIWALDKGFTTLLPTTTLMPPADARLMKNHRGVRMFKEGDFLAGAALEKWDRVTCTQPFNKQEQFGLSFIRVLSTPDEEDEERLEGSGVRRVV
ncbi:protein XNDC1N-like [Ranitomeya variabilis]|uniref:protein XNDC1N-like n=1 Tax=Ranitomeya variabilis TaxID=490064 RepID=UPI004056057F